MKKRQSQIDRYNEIAGRWGEQEGMSLQEMREDCQRRALQVGPGMITTVLDPAELEFVVVETDGQARLI